MKKTIAASSSILLGIGLLSLGGGLQGSLLGIRSTMEGFSTVTTGIIISGFFIGYLTGAIWVPRFVNRVGHIRVFGAFASIASANILLHLILIHPVIWTAIRFVSGFCWAGIAVVAESWLNHNADNRTRGKILAIFMMVQMVANGCGQLFLNTGDPGGFILFALVSILISFSLVPVLLTATTAPDTTSPSILGLRSLYKISPLGVLGTFGVGVAHGTLIGMGMVYAHNKGFSVLQISLFMSMIFWGGAVFQWPIGMLSDRLDRRRVIIWTTFIAAGLSLLALFIPESASAVLFPFIFILGGVSLPLYSLCIAHTNDHIKREQMVAASSGLTLVVGVGTAIGPVTVGAVMEIVGPAGFFYFLVIVHVAIGAFALYRTTQRPAVPIEEQKHVIPFPLRSTPVVAGLAEESFTKPEKDPASH